jgi:hypothetical protein
VALKFGITGSIGLTFGKMWVDGVQAVPGDNLPGWTPNLLTEHTTLDDISNGVTFGRIKTTALDKLGNLDLASTGVVNRGALALKDTVNNLDLDTDKRSLKKVSGGMLDAGSTADTIILNTGKKLNTQNGRFLPKRFTSMPTVSEVEDGELFIVTEGTRKGIYVRNGSVAMNGAGGEENFSV